MRRVPWWGLMSSAAAPVLLIGGWTLAARRQPTGYDPVRDTISSLAARDATDRWLMTTALVGVGACHVVTALALRPAARTGRVLLAVGGGATVAVALFPLPSGAGRSGPHTVAAALAFAGLTLWPAASAGPRACVATTPAWPLRRPAAVTATLVLGALVGWFALDLAEAGQVGLAERVAAGAQACWPLVVVLAVRGAQRRA